MKFKVLIVMFMMILTVGCSKDKTAITGSDFYDKAIEAEYKVVDNTYQFDYADYVYSITKGDLKMYFVDGKKSYDLKGLFLDECANVYKNMTEEYDKSTSGGENWTTLKIKNDETFYYVSWIKDTYLYVEAPISKEKELKKFIDSIGY